MTRPFNPKWVSPPCDTIGGFIEELGIDFDHLSKEIGSPTLAGLMRNLTRIDESLAAKLAKSLGSTPEFWLNIQRDYEQQASNCGDLLLIEKGIIGHQVNCQGVMGAGIAKQIAKRYPEVLRDYKNHLRLRKPEDALGTFCLSYATKDLAVLSLFGQLDYGRGRCYTDYDALRAIAAKLRTYESLIHLPAKMGCGLGGGNWDQVREIFANVNVIWVAA